MLGFSAPPNLTQSTDRLSKRREASRSVLPRNSHEKIHCTKAGKFMEWKLLAAILWLLNPVVIMTKLLRTESKVN